MSRTLYWLNLITIVLVLVLMGWQTASVLQTQQALEEFNQRQILIVRDQNYLQICAHHDTLVAVRKIGLSLGLPVDDLQAPDVEGLNCAARLSASQPGT